MILWYSDMNEWHCVMFRAFYNPGVIVKIAVITRLAGVCETWVDRGTEINSSRLWSDHASASRGRPLTRSLYHLSSPAQIIRKDQSPYTELVYSLSITLVVLSVHRFVLFVLVTFLCVFVSHSLPFLKTPQKHFQMASRLFPFWFFKKKNPFKIHPSDWTFMSEHFISRVQTKLHE